jgi:hypothetical protein
VLRLDLLGFKSDGAAECVEILDDALIKAIDPGSVSGLQAGIAANGSEKAGGNGA